MAEDPLIGRQLASFRVERLLGRGGMARVYYGWDVKLERPVAIKVIDVQYRDVPAYAERFVREARSVATWRHENVIQIYFADDQDGLYYFVMEYIDGTDLGELLAGCAADGARVLDEDVIYVGWAIARALDYAHERGVIHRDVKPTNVMIASDGRVVLTDFGLAMDVAQGTLGEVFGSSHYIAPEQARSSAGAVPQSDLYSLGVILYQMLVGSVPFDDPSPTSVALQHCTRPPPPPREINPDLCEETEAVLLRALSKSPEERYQTGAELMEALDKALSKGARRQKPEMPAKGGSEMSVLERVAQRAGKDTAVLERVPAAEPSSLLGSQLDEYRLEALLGQGGMARVYRGLDVNLGRRVAIKVIDTPFRTDEAYLERFRREAQAIAKLEHPHIVRLYRYGEAKGLLYMAMQYVEGADLGTVLADYRRDGEFIDPQEASRIVREVCLALDYAHARGVIHRDVKPSNVLLDRQGDVIVADFGLALLTEFGTQGQILGSPRYTAPEQAVSSAKVVPQSDLYAVGVMLYEMFAGQVPFDGDDPLDVALMHVSDAPRPPRELNPQIGPELEGVILTALAKEPSDRYQSGAKLADALDAALAVAQAQAQPEQRDVTRPAAKDTPPGPPALPPAPPMVSGQAQGVGGGRHDIQPDRQGASPVASSERTAEPELGSTAFRRTVWPRHRKSLVLYLGILSVICALSTVLSVGAYLLLSGTAARWLAQRPGTETPTSLSLTGTPPSGLPASMATPSLVPLVTATPTGTLVPRSALTPSVTPTPAGMTTTPAAVPTPTLMVTPTATTTLTVAPTATPTLTVSPTVTPTSTSTATPTPSPSPTADLPASYTLLAAKRSEEGVYVVNQTDTPFPLAPLRLGDGNESLDGAAWGLEELESGACVVVWKDRGNPRPPAGLACQQAADVLRRSKAGVFWDQTFYAYYQEDLVGVCEKDRSLCTITIPNRAGYRLRIVKRDEGLFLANHGEEVLPLAPLRLGDGDAAVQGQEWDVATLGRDDCVAVWREKGDPKFPAGFRCNRVDEHLPRLEGEEQFWRGTFVVYYAGVSVGTCEKEQIECFVNVPID